MAYLLFVLICLFFGSNFILMDRAGQWFGPAEIGLGRLLGGALVMGLIWLVAERKKRLRLGALRDVLVVAFIANSYPYVAQPMLIGMGFGHSFFGMTITFTPLLTILVSLPLLGVKPSSRQLIGVLAGLGFATMLLWDGNLRGISVPMLAIAVTVPLSYAVGNTWLRRTLGDEPPTPLAAVLLFVAVVCILPVSASPDAQSLLSIEPPTVRENFWSAFAALAMLGVFGTGACIGMFVRLVQDRGPLFAGMVTYVVPVIALLWGLVDGEAITTRQMIAMTGILAMVALVQAPATEIQDVVQDLDDGFEPEGPDSVVEPAEV